ncbi:hypothetical protein Pla108_13480 [Botrimarina colliarenosi]|uniref:Uncharacterized protein n=1 Tax=Botrimarina colliarenosi TaxID=2528001 RepID=A0A5C6ALP8_9BACT|nr:hypothetical protein Pla108_13480 [Botrimarina colliarenosi]
MTERPRLEAAEVFRGGGSRFLDRYGKTLSHAQHRALRAIVACRTKVLGGHADRWGVRRHAAELQLVPQSALPEVSGIGSRCLA